MMDLKGMPKPVRLVRQPGRIIWSFTLINLILLGTISYAADPKSHAELIQNWNAESLARGEKLYHSICVTCHGTPEKTGSIPTSRPFWKEPFKNGSDPLSIYKTIGTGLGQMPAWPWLEPQMRYDIIQYIREAFLKPYNQSAYFPITPEYLASLPKEALPTEKSAEAVELEKTPKYLRMDFGQSLNWTYQVEPGNIAYKAIAVRLDPGPGGVSKGHAWILYDHDTIRVAAAWMGDKFVDWRGIAFDGSHQTHTSIVGEKAFVNPVGPGWADPRTGSFDDPRFHGRDDKPYGPLPREWAHFKGLYRYGEQVVISYTVGDAQILELPGIETNGNTIAFSRTLNIGPSSRDLWMRIAPEATPVTLVGESGAAIQPKDGFNLLRIPAGATPLKLKLLIGNMTAQRDTLLSLAARSHGATDLKPLLHGAAPRWNLPMITTGQPGTNDHPFAVDTIALPTDEQNPWQSWMRLGGFDFFSNGKRAAVCTWLGEVWLVSGIDGDLRQVTWKRIAAGLFQPLGVKIVDDVIYVTCRDQIVRLHDLNGDDEIDFYENFNSDHQVTEHFHEFAMGLQTDTEGNFYYAKSARHALPALVPHHGTLLKVSKDGSRTDIIATGFRAANGVCVNEDGTFFVTDQEGHWTPKNRINLVKPGGFYGNMFGYHDHTSSADSEMEQPVVWITNDMDRSPGEIVPVASDQWGPLKGELLNLSYGTGRIFLIPHETVNNQMQGGVVQLPMPDLPTGVMRGRFHPGNGQLYACGLFAWAGNKTADGGFFRIRYTGKALYLPIGLHAASQMLTIRFTDALDKAEAEKAANYSLKRWGLKRSAEYGSKHYNETALSVASVVLDSDRRTIHLKVPDLQPTWCMEIAYHLRGTNGESISQKLHNTIHNFGSDNPTPNR